MKELSERVRMVRKIKGQREKYRVQKIVERGEEIPWEMRREGLEDFKEFRL